MTITLIPAFSAEITIGADKTTFRNREEFSHFCEKYLSISLEQSLLRATLIVTRTGNWGDFLKDLLLPTCFNVNHLALRVLGFALDVITFIPRVIIAPFRIYYNNKRADHPIIPLIKEKTGSGLVKVRIECKSVDIWEGSSTKMAKEMNFEEERIIAIQPHPKISHQPANLTIRNYHQIDGEWAPFTTPHEHIRYQMPSEQYHRVFGNS